MIRILDIKTTELKPPVLMILPRASCSGDYKECAVFRGETLRNASATQIEVFLRSRKDVILDIENMSDGYDIAKNIMDKIKMSKLDCNYFTVRQ